MKAMQDRLQQLKGTKAQRVTQGQAVGYSFPLAEMSFPLIFAAQTPGLLLAEWVKENQGEINAKLITHGALLFRGFGIDTVEKFQALMEAFEAQPLEYKHRSSPRYEVARNIYLSTTYPPEESIHMHSENSYAFNWARHIVFCCIQQAEEQGETPIADNRLVLAGLSAETRDKFARLGVKYVRNISKGIGLSWQEIFQTQDKQVVEAECQANGMDLRWVGEGKLVLTWNNHAIHEHPQVNQPVWFNHAFFFNKYTYSADVLSALASDDELPFNTYYGDGSEIPEGVIQEIRAAYEKATVIFPWQRGDVLFMDNMLMAHGRRPYKGERKIIVSMF